MSFNGQQFIENARRRVQEAQTRVQSRVAGMRGNIGAGGLGQQILGQQRLLGAGGVLAGKLPQIPRLLEGQRLGGFTKIREVRERGVASVLETTFPKIREVRGRFRPSSGGIHSDITDRPGRMDMAIESKPAKPADHRDMSFEL